MNTVHSESADVSPESSLPRESTEVTNALLSLLEEKRISRHSFLKIAGIAAVGWQAVEKGLARELMKLLMPEAMAETVSPEIHEESAALREQLKVHGVEADQPVDRQKMQLLVDSLGTSVFAWGSRI